MWARWVFQHFYIADLYSYLVGSGRIKPRSQPQQRSVLTDTMWGAKGTVPCGFHSLNKLSLSTGLGTEHTAGSKTDEVPDRTGPQPRGED